MKLHGTMKKVRMEKNFTSLFYDKRIRYHRRGFTLVEVLISLLIFSIVITMAVGALFSMVDAGEESRSTNSVMENLSVALETMAQTVQSSSNYAPGSLTATPIAGICVNSTAESALYIKPSTGSYLNIGLASTQQITDIVYGLQNSQIVERIDYSNGSSTIIPITAAEVHVTNLTFWINNCSLSKQSVLMAINGFSETRQNNKVNFNIQTTMTAL